MHDIFLSSPHTIMLYCSDENKLVLNTFTVQKSTDGSITAEIFSYNLIKKSLSLRMMNKIYCGYAAISTVLF